MIAGILVYLAIAGIVFFGESASAARVGCIALIVVGILGLRLTGTAGV